MIGSLCTLVFTETLWGKSDHYFYRGANWSSGTLNDLPNFPASKWGIQDSNLGVSDSKNPCDVLSLNSPKEEGA